MRRYLKLIGIDVAIALATVALFSPGLLGLTPLDPNPVVAAASVTAGVALAGTAVVANKRLLSGPTYRMLEIGDGSASSPSASFDDVYMTLVEHSDDRYVGRVAASAAQQMESAARRRGRLMAAIDGKFEQGSLTWQRFSSVVESATSAIVRNSAMLANRVQAFDADGYAEIVRLTSTGAYHGDAIPDDIQEERRRIYERDLDSLQSVLAANERMLLEMDRFAAELSALDSAALASGSDEMLEEIRRLVDQTRLYADVEPHDPGW